jgi:hypothetical protein
VSGSATLTVTNAPAVSIGFLRTLVDPASFLATNSTAMWQATGLITTATNITTGNTASYYLQDGTGGVNLFVTGGSAFRPNMGDVVTVIGFLSSFGGLELEVDLTGGFPARNATMVQILSNNIAAYPLPKVLSWEHLGVAPTNADLNYNVAGSVVILTNVYFYTNTGVVTPPPGTRANKFYWVTNSAGKFTQVAVYDQLVSDLTNRTLPAFAYSVQGVLIPFGNPSTGVPTNGNYEVGITRWIDVNTNTPAAPLISGGPANQTNVVGTTAAFSATVAGYAPLSYQWLYNGSPLSDNGRITGSSTTALSIGNVSLGDAGTYSLQASNWVGVATKSATLTVTGPAPIPLEVQTLGGGANLQFTWSDPLFSLAQATNVLGPYVKIPGAVSGYITGTTNAESYFRLTWP